MAKVKLTITESRCRGGYCKAGDIYYVEDLYEFLIKRPKLFYQKLV